MKKLNDKKIPVGTITKKNPSTMIAAAASITKKRGVVIRSASELDEISLLLSHPKVGELSRKIDEVNPKRETTTGKGGPDIFEI